MNADTIAAVALIAPAAWLSVRWLWRELAAANDRHIDRHVDRALTTPLPPPDAPDEAFEAWAVQALGIANTPAMQRTLREIHSLPETEAR